MRACIAALVLVMGSSSAFAQTQTPATPAVAVTPIESQWIVVPEAKLTDLVFEPQANVTFAVTRRIRFGVSGGYRLTTGAEGFGHDIDGATGTLSVQFGLGT